MPMNNSAIQKAVEIVGGQTALARSLGRSQGLVWMWCEGRLAVPAKYCRLIEELVAHRLDATGGVRSQAVTRYDLRPDVFGEAPATELREAG